MEKGNGLSHRILSYSLCHLSSEKKTWMPKKCHANQEPKVTGRQQKMARFHPEALYSKVWWKHLQTNAELSAKPNFAAD